MKKKLYNLMEEYQTVAAAIKRVQTTDPAALSAWGMSNYYVVPWQTAEDISTLPSFKSAVTYPDSCGSYAENRRRRI